MSAEAGSPITTYFRVCDGVRVRFADTKADSDVTVLLLAPWPETLWAFRRIWDRVSAVGRVVAIDMPGFGHSDGRPELIAPDASGAFLAGLIDEWGLGAPHVVGPDVGTAAALFLAAKAPERVTSLTIGGGAVRFPIEAGGALKDIIEAPSLDVVRGLDARTNIGYAVEPGAASDSEPEVHEDYVSAYDLGRFAESARFVRHYPEQNPVLRDLLPTITTPTQIVAGRDDDLVPWSNNQYLHDLLPNSEIHPLDAGHFAWEQAAEEYGRLVVDWVSGGYRRVEPEGLTEGAAMTSTHEQTTTETPTTYADASTQRVTAGNGIEYAYRDVGAGDVPLVLLQHFRGNLDNWDPALVDALAAERRVVTFDNVGVGGTTGTTPSTIEAMAHDAIAFVEALGLQRVDLLGFSIGSFVAQEIALIRPDLLRRVVLASAAPQGAAGMHGWAPRGDRRGRWAARRARRDTSRSSSPPRTRVAKRASRPPDASSGEDDRPRRADDLADPPGAVRRRLRLGHPEPLAARASRPRSSCRSSSPTATATR